LKRQPNGDAEAQGYTGNTSSLIRQLLLNILLLAKAFDFCHCKPLLFFRCRFMSPRQTVKKQLTAEKIISIRGRVESAMMLVVTCNLQFSKLHEPLGFWAEFATMAGLYGIGDGTVYLKSYMA
jgi:hypothetical protein